MDSHRRPLDPKLRAELIENVQEYRGLFRAARRGMSREEFVAFRATIMQAHRTFRSKAVEAERTFRADLETLFEDARQRWPALKRQPPGPLTSRRRVAAFRRGRQRLLTIDTRRQRS